MILEDKWKITAHVFENKKHIGIENGPEEGSNVWFCHIKALSKYTTVF